MVRIGIMTHRVVPGPRLNSMRARARMAGFDDVVVFSPAHVNLKRRKLCGYVYRSPGWKRTTCAIPPVIHDIGYYTSRDLLKKAIRIKRRSRLLFTGYGLGNKERIERMIKSHPVLNGFVLPSLRPSTVEQALEFVRQHRDVAVKPLNGSRGRGIRKVSLTDRGYRIEDDGNPPVLLDASDMVRLVEGRLLHECCLWQKWIHTAGSDGGPFDIRALVQKDGDGVWNIRGKGVREGRKGNITSNVAKGGILHAFDDYIAARFGGEFARLLDRQIDLIALLAARHLERKSGRRLVELGFDLALDHTGHPWILEVNVKPGRKVIRRLYGNGMARTCETAPFLYARHLLNRRHGRPPRPVSRRSDRE